eukprot:5011824-Pleurochrysis_carterae.AAC.7
MLIGSTLLVAAPNTLRLVALRVGVPDEFRTSTHRPARVLCVVSGSVDHFGAFGTTSKRHIKLLSAVAAGILALAWLHTKLPFVPVVRLVARQRGFKGSK